MQSTDTVIIGAGPYGLSLATYLSAAGVPHEILGQPMLAWRNFMPPGMLLRSEAFASSLYAPHRGFTFEAYCRHKGIRYQPVAMHVPLESFVDYALWFQSNLVGHVRPAEVVEMRRVDGQFQLSLSDGGALEARRVVLALGLKGFAQTPKIFQGFPRSHVSHSAEYGGLTWAAKKDIVIVGGGQSALGLAALLNEIGARVHVLVREGTVTWNDKPDAQRGFVSKLIRPEAGIGPGWRSHVVSEYPFIFHALGRQRRKEIVERTWGPSGAWWLRDRVVDKIDVRLRTEVRHLSIDGDQVVLSVASGNGESRMTTQHVVVATGFRTDLRRHAFLSHEILDSIRLVDGVPELTGQFETTLRGFYVIGPASAYSFGPVMRFVYGAKYAAPHVAQHISRSFRSEGVQKPTAADACALSE